MEAVVNRTGLKDYVRKYKKVEYIVLLSMAEYVEWLVCCCLINSLGRF